MKDQQPSIEIETIVGQQKSEFAIFVGDSLAFSRLQQRRFPELDDLLDICQAAGQACSQF